jgi:hypothetical protein
VLANHAIDDAPLFARAFRSTIRINRLRYAHLLAGKSGETFTETFQMMLIDDGA